MENVKSPISVSEEGIFQQLLFSLFLLYRNLATCGVVSAAFSVVWVAPKALPSHGGCFGDAPGQELGLGTIYPVRLMSKYP